MVSMNHTVPGQVLYSIIYVIAYRYGRQLLAATRPGQPQSRPRIQLVNIPISTILFSGMGGWVHTRLNTAWPRLKICHPSMPFTCSESPRLHLRIPTPRLKPSVVCVRSSWGKGLDSVYTCHRSIRYAHPDVHFLVLIQASSHLGIS